MSVDEALKIAARIARKRARVGFDKLTPVDQAVLVLRDL